MTAKSSSRACCSGMGDAFCAAVGDGSRPAFRAGFCGPRRGLSLGPVLAVLLALGSLPRAAAAQSVMELSRPCTAQGALEALCVEAAVVAQALQGGAALLTGPGTEVAGSASTLGRRLGRTPRLAVSGRAGFAPLGVPDLTASGTNPARKATFLVPSLRGEVTAGVFDGFSLIPTVGGILSLDLLAAAGVVFLPEAEGFNGPVTAFSFGARLGILRESFTTPGISLSYTRRYLGEVTFGEALSGSRSVARVDPVVNALRLTVGKDILSVGVMAGVGRDEYGGSARIDVRGFPAAGIEEFSSHRTLFFGGISWNLLILQISAEGGWARGFPAVPGYQGAPYDPTSGRPFAGFAFRLTI
ncbi:MAG: hypothetical protein ACE5GJ_05585 [Gemmatimonadota bacterium]